MTENKKGKKVDKLRESALASAEELKDLADTANRKLDSSSRTVTNRIFNFDETRAEWQPTESLIVTINRGTMGHPDAFDVAIVENLGRQQGIEAELTKHYIHIPPDTHTYEEERAEWYGGKRLRDETHQRIEETKRDIADEMGIQTPEELDDRMSEIVVTAIKRVVEKDEREPTPEEVTSDRVQELLQMIKLCGPDNEVVIESVGGS